MKRVLQGYFGFRPFSDEEAWFLFRLAAFAEAFGWTLLIIGIVLKRYVMHGNNAPVMIAGQIHGTLFLLYIAAAVIATPSMGWPVWKILLAGASSVPPYGSLVFEWLAGQQRSARTGILQLRLSQYRQLVNFTESIGGAGV